ncbi:hypothetical protein [Lentzea sp. NPDC059081]|uniref:hypothetical protein n=1 Tax=Lentzea sp. NPDC059081 TaxID=3346719 RepID=UPI0036747CC8
MNSPLADPAAVKNPLDRLTAAADHYRRTFGWNTEVRGQNVLATLSGSLGAVVMSVARVRQVHRRIANLDEPCPTIVIPGDRSLTWVVLADLGDRLPGDAVPPGLRVLPMFTRLPLPPSALDAGVVRWHTELDPGRRWLPSMATVLAAGAPRVDADPRCPRPARHPGPRGRVPLRPFPGATGEARTAW